MNFEDIIDQFRSIELPTGALAVGSIIVLVIALKVVRRALRMPLILAAVALFVAAVLWHIRKHL